MDQKYPVMVSVYVPTFNHEKYLVQALDSILMQKTQYSYEVLVGEDFSTDNTRQVLREYEAAHPGRLTVFYREENMHRKPINNAGDLKRRCKGKYIIALEGDDFWTDENKLEKQVAFLEQHPDYIAVAHNCLVVGEDSQPNGEYYPECKRQDYTFTHFFDRIMPGQLTTLLCRNYMLPGSMDISLMTQGLTPGDQLLYFTLLYHGKVYCMQEVMSAYRHITSTGSSFSATVRFQGDKEMIWYQALRNYAKKQNRFWPICNAEALCISVSAMSVRLGQWNREKAWNQVKQLDHPVLAGYLWFWRGIKRRLVRMMTPKEKQTFSQRGM